MQKKSVWTDYKQLFRVVFSCFGGQNFLFNFKKILATALKSYIKWFLYIYFLKFEKVEKIGIISTKFSLRCTPSVILGVAVLSIIVMLFFSQMESSKIFNCLRKPLQMLFQKWQLQLKRVCMISIRILPQILPLQHLANLHHQEE